MRALCKQAGKFRAAQFHGFRCKFDYAKGRAAGKRRRVVFANFMEDRQGAEPNGKGTLNSKRLEVVVERLGEYGIVRLIGQGAMGKVFEARMPIIDEVVAIKRLSVDDFPRDDRDVRTRSGFFMGTLDFAAPEQSDAGKEDLRADLYAVGILLYLMLTGRHPHQTRFKDPSLLRPGIAKGWDDFVRKAPERYRRGDAAPPWKAAAA